MLLFQKNGEILLTHSQLLPSILITNGEDQSFPLDRNSKEFIWIMKQSRDWEDASEYESLRGDDENDVCLLIFFEIIVLRKLFFQKKKKKKKMNEINLG